MKQFRHNGTSNWPSILTRIALVLTSVTIIVLFLPRDSSRLLHYSEGQPWTDGALIAPIDFPVFKSEATLKYERDSVRERFQPYFNWDDRVEEQSLQAFHEKFKDGIPGLTGNYVQIIAHRLHQIYERGVLDPTQLAQYSDGDTTTAIRVVTGKEAVTLPTDSVLTTLGAYKYLFLDDRLMPVRAKLQACNLNDFISPNLRYDRSRSEMELNDNLSLITQASGMVLKGQRLITQGDIVTSRMMLVLNSYERAMAKQSASENELRSTIAGQTIYILLLVSLFTLYLALFRKDYFTKPRSIAMLYALLVFFPLLTSFMMKHPFFSIYIIPFAISPIFGRVFMDSRTAFIQHVTTILICAVAVKYQYEFITVQLVAGLVAIYSLRELSRRSQIFLTAILVTAASALVYFALQLIQTDDVSKLDRAIYYHFTINGFFLLFTYPLMLVIEKAFGFTSTVTLFELSNTNNPLLRELSEKAPGTFQHSITVGNLGAEIANKIGAKAQLVRTGALYHDIGKMENAVYFTENQAGFNPHDKLSDTESAAIIIGHVTEGLRLAEEHHLPQVIRDFIATHHGTGLTRYFYIKYTNEHPDEEVDESLFRYSGPNPFTREQAILMICDTVEAASRSLKEYSPESISALVDSIIQSQVREGFFNDCPITFRDLQTAKNVLIGRLKSIYHTRISYPELSEEARKKVEEKKEEEEKKREELTEQVTEGTEKKEEDNV